MILGPVTPLGGHSPAIVFEVDEDSIKQVGELVGQQRFSDATLTGVADDDFGGHKQDYSALTAYH